MVHLHLALQKENSLSPLLESRRLIFILEGEVEVCAACEVHVVLQVSVEVVILQVSVEVVSQTSHRVAGKGNAGLRKQDLQLGHTG
jgi:hypothetical protein